MVRLKVALIAAIVGIGILAVLGYFAYMTIFPQSVTVTLTAPTTPPDNGFYARGGMPYH